MTRIRKNALIVLGAAAVLLPQTQAGTFTANFNDNTTPANSFLNGRNGGGVIENGILKITKNVNDQSGGFVIDDLDAGAPIYGFTFTAKVRVGGGSPGNPADGFSISFGPDISDTVGAAPGGFEDGVGSGLRIAFDIFDNGSETPPGPSIDLRLGNTVITSYKSSVPELETGTNFVDLNLTVTPAGAVTLTYGGKTIFNNVYFPGYQGIPGGRLAIAGRTGGLNENIWFDDISLSTTTTPQVGVVTPPTSQTVLVGQSVTFSPVFNNADSATFQWLRNGVALTSETNPTLTITPSAADTGAKFSVRVTGPNNIVTTSEATLTVVDIPLPAPTAFYDFTSADGTAPDGTLLFNTTASSGYIAVTNGEVGPGVLHLVDAVNGQWGGFIVNDLAAGAPVYGITAHFKALVGGGSAVPADGFSFNFASDIPDDPGNIEYENGIGTGLTVGFDIYDNGGGEAPSIDVRYGGNLIAQAKVPISFINTGDQWADVVIRLENDGTLDVAYKGVVVFNNLLIPGFSSITGGRVALGARTGGLNDNMWIDDLAITPNLVAGDLRITTQPLNRYVLTGQTVNLSSAVNDETGVTYQWLRNGTPIGGANSASYSFAATAADNGATYSLRATRGGLTATSTAATVTVLNITPTVTFNFDAGVLPAGTTNYGNAYFSVDGGVTNTGVLHITDAVNSQAGAFIIEPLLGGAEVAAINVAFDLRLGGGTQNAADGFSFNWGANLPESTLGGAEEGAGIGLTITFDIYDNGGGEAPSIDIKWNGTTLSQTKLSKADIQTDFGGAAPAFRTVIVKVTADGKVDLVYGDRVIATGVQIPNYAPITNAKFGFYARTGGENENQWVDNIIIQAIKSTAPLRIVTQPADALLMPGQTATFTVGVSDPTGATFQWSRNGTPIAGANSATYTTPALTLADTGAQYSVTITGPGGAPVSRNAIATVVAPLTIGTPDLTIDFNAGVPPDGMPTYGTAYVSADGGVDNTGVLHLTDAVGNQGGSFYIPDFDNGEAVSSFTANFKVRIAPLEGQTPADGMSFVWANDVAAGTIFGEDGTGQGLKISFDTYDNGGGEAPAFDVWWKGNIIATDKVPISTLLTGDGFADVFIRLESDGTVDMQYNGKAIFNNVQLPDFTPLANASFAFGGRTGGANANQWVDDIKIVTGTGAAAPQMSIARNPDGSLNITWAGGGTLQSAPIVTGPWNTLTGQGSPATVQTTGTMQFFRVVQ